jgi:hypothetical protein
MKTAQIKISAPVYFAAGEHLNGATLVAPAWVRSGDATVELEKAQALERDGFADIVSIDGAANVWGACCGDH